MSRKKNTACINIGKNKNWNSSWCVYNQKEYRFLFQEDITLYSYLRSQFTNIEPIIIINFKFYRVDNFLILDLILTSINLSCKQLLVKFLNSLSKFYNKPIYLAINKLSPINIQKNGFNIALKIAQFLERRVKFRSKIIKTLIKKAKENCKGIYVECTGRINNVDMARADKLYMGSIPLQSIKASISHGFVVANTIKGLQSIKVWICQ
jgi:small subunit ribosomal protein S3